MHIQQYSVVKKDYVYVYMYMYILWTIADMTSSKSLLSLHKTVIFRPSVALKLRLEMIVCSSSEQPSLFTSNVWKSHTRSCGSWAVHMTRRETWPLSSHDHRSFGDSLELTTVHLNMTVSDGHMSPSPTTSTVTTERFHTIYSLLEFVPP